MTVGWSCKLVWRHQAETSEIDAWSRSIIGEIENHIKWLLTSAPTLTSKLKYEAVYEKAIGSDFEVCLTDAVGTKHYLLFEIEWHASGGELDVAAKAWAKRHFQQSNTTTIIVSLALQVLRSSLYTKFPKDGEVAKMATSQNFGVFAASGDGRISEELGEFIASWIEDKLSIGISV